MNPDKLIAAATEALEQAYAPYSGYRVGAALLCADGSIFTGCNVENAAYGLSNCAERTAFFSAVSAGQQTFQAIAIAASAEPAPFPCGACRQIMAEFCKPNFPIYIATGNSYTTATLAELLPQHFGAGKTPN